MARRTLPAFAAAVALASVLACDHLPFTGREGIEAVDPLPSPAGGPASSPQLMSEGSHAVLSWLEPGEGRTALRFSERTAAGWSEARTLVSSEELLVNSADVPSIQFLGDSSYAAQWLERLGSNPEAYSLLVSFSEDGGVTWSPPVHPHHDDTLTQHGFASFFRLDGGRIGLVWLDGRTTDLDQPDDIGDMALWSASFGPDHAQTSESVLDERVCDCCQTSAARTANTVVVAYRDRNSSEVRDIAVTRFEDGHWSSASPVHADGWTIRGCPVNGPAIDARGDNVVVAWFTAASGSGRVLTAFSHDGGRSFLPPVPVDDGAPRGRVDVTLVSDRVAFVSWTEAVAGHSEFRVRRIRSDDEAPGPSTTIAQVRGADYPKMTVNGDELLFAWTISDEGTTFIRTARASVP